MKKVSAVVFCIIFWLIEPISAYGKYEYIGDCTSFTSEDNIVTFNCGISKVRIEIYASDIVSVWTEPSGNFNKTPSYAVVEKEWLNPKPTVKDMGAYIQVETEELVIKAQKFPFRLSFYDKNGKLLNRDSESNGMGWDGEKIVIYKDLAEDNHFYGFGERTGVLDKKNSFLTMWTTDTFAYGVKDDPIYNAIPFFIDTMGYGLFFDNTYKSTFDMGKSSKKHYIIKSNGGELLYYFIYGPGFKKIVTDYTEITGGHPLPPKWVFGYQQCKWSYHNQGEVLNICKTFREKDIPCDVVYIDLDWMSRPDERYFTGLKWNLKDFPEPKKMADKMEEQGFKLIVIVDPNINTGLHNFKEEYLVKNEEGKVSIVEWLWGGPSGIVDFSMPEAGDWWARQHYSLIEDGVDAFWLDMNEPSRYNDDMVFQGGKIDEIHNLYGFLHNKATYLGIKKQYPDRRIWLMTRSGFAGMQRYTSTWSGDSISTWKHLKCMIQMGQNIGLSGVSYWGHDIGGFFLANNFPTEKSLFARWMQFGTFSPLCRAHACHRDHEPWRFGKKVEDICRKYIKLRYKLIPYLYTYAWKSAQTGLPIMRAMFLEFQEDPNTYLLKNSYQYMFGKELLIAPVYEESSSRKIYLPEGKWIDYWTGETYEGLQTINYKAPLDTMPILVKAGAIIPMQQDMDYINQKPVDPLTLDIYPSGKSSFTLYEDDGETMDYQKVKYTLTEFECVETDSGVEVSIGDSDRSYLLNVHYSTPKTVKYNTKEVNRLSSKSEIELSPEGWFYDSENKIVIIKIYVKGVGKIIL